jgi:hypothetical protein
MILKNNSEVSIQHGDHQLTLTMSAGTAKLQVSVDGGAFQDVPDSAEAASSVYIASLCTCKVRAVLTGDATMSINRVTP